MSSEGKVTSADSTQSTPVGLAEAVESYISHVHLALIDRLLTNYIEIGSEFAWHNLTVG